MHKTVVFHTVVRSRADYLTDNTEYGFYFDVVDSSLVGEPEERASTAKYRIKVGITYELLINWRLDNASEDDLIKVLFHYARKYVKQKIKDDTLTDYEELLLSTKEHREGYCPLDISRIPNPVGFTSTIEVDGQQYVTSVRSAVILTALPVEYKAVSAHLTNLREDTHPQGTVYEQGDFSSTSQSWKVGIVEVGAGNPGAAMEAERSIQHFRPDVVIFVGIAGGIKDAALGDVVAATKVYGYESGKAGETFHPRPEVVNSTYRMVQRARAEMRNENWLQRIKVPRATEPRVFVGPIAAGEKVVASTRSDIYNFIQSQYSDALAVEMEGFGFLKAIQANPGVEALVIRGISDLIDCKAEVDASGFQDVAAQNASAFAFEVLANSVIPGITSKKPSSARLSGLKRKLEKQRNKLPYVMGLHLNHPDANLWRRTTKRYLRELDEALPGDDWERRYNNIPWHPPNGLAKDAREQQTIYTNACNSADGLLRDALLKWQEELDTI